MTGVNYISVGRITMSSPAVDIGMDYKGGYEASVAESQVP